MHRHTWNTPPFDEKTNVINSLLYNLPELLQYKKQSILHTTKVNIFNITTVSFRSGRFGFSHEVAKNILKLVYQIDTSTAQYADWTNCQGPGYSNVSP